MKKLMIIVLALCVLATPAMADWSVPDAASYYLDDKTVMSLIDFSTVNESTAFIGGYCEEVGKGLAGRNGSNQAALFEIGIRNQDVQAYTAMCYATIDMQKQMTADDVRALAFIIGTLLEEDAVNLESTPLTNTLYIVDFKLKKKAGFSTVTLTRSLFNLYELHPNGLPKAAKKLYSALFNGQGDKALKVLRSVGPSQGTKDIVASYMNKE